MTGRRNRGQNRTSSRQAQQMNLDELSSSLRSGEEFVIFWQPRTRLATLPEERIQAADQPYRSLIKIWASDVVGDSKVVRPSPQRFRFAV